MLVANPIPLLFSADMCPCPSPKWPCVELKDCFLTLKLTVANENQAINSQERFPPLLEEANVVERNLFFVLPLSYLEGKCDGWSSSSCLLHEIHELKMMEHKDRTILGPVQLWSNHTKSGL